MFSAETWYGLLIIITLRYFLIAGVAYLIWYKLKRNKLAYKKIQQHFPERKDYQREIFYSLITIIIFAVVPAAMLLTPFRQYTQYYEHINEHSMGWFWLAFPTMFIVHDTYFYWMHRAMHQPNLFKLFHVVHHKSTNPSPWAAFSFQPSEAFFEARHFCSFDYDHAAACYSFICIFSGNDHIQCLRAFGVGVVFCRFHETPHRKMDQYLCQPQPTP
jgi:lathosterol oxidase